MPGVVEVHKQHHLFFHFLSDHPPDFKVIYFDGVRAAIATKFKTKVLGCTFAAKAFRKLNFNFKLIPLANYQVFLGPHLHIKMVGPVNILHKDLELKLGARVTLREEYARLNDERVHQIELVHRAPVVFLNHNAINITTGRGSDNKRTFTLAYISRHCAPTEKRKALGVAIKSRVILLAKFHIATGSSTQNYQIIEQNRRSRIGYGCTIRHADVTCLNANMAGACKFRRQSNFGPFTIVE